MFCSHCDCALFIIRQHILLNQLNNWGFSFISEEKINIRQTKNCSKAAGKKYVNVKNFLLPSISCIALLFCLNLLYFFFIYLLIYGYVYALRAKKTKVTMLLWITARVIYVKRHFRFISTSAIGGTNKSKLEPWANNGCHIKIQLSSYFQFTLRTYSCIKSPHPFLCLIIDDNVQVYRFC